MKAALVAILMLFLFTAAPACAEKGADPADDTQEDTRVDWVDVESTGILSSAKGGALEKTLWAGQKRSEIEKGIEELPDTQAMRSLLSLQRRLLLSSTDASLIDNDTPAGRGDDLLIQRIKKLMDMGLYDDAWSLYTEKAENPYNAPFAQLGMLLLLMKNDMATACLEEKVLAARYPDDGFFNDLDRACNASMGLGSSPKFEKSEVLNAVYNDKAYTVSAAEPDALIDMSGLERALVLANGKIRYDGLTDQIVARTEPSILALYLMDKTLPEPAKAMIKAETDRRGLSWYIASVAKDPTWKKAKDLGKDATAQWPVLETALSEKTNPYDLNPYIPMLATAKPTDLSTDSVIKVMGAFLAYSKPLPAFWAEQAKAKAQEKPIIYLYLKSFDAFTSTKGVAPSEENLQKSLEILSEEDRQMMLAVLEPLDKGGLVFNNPLRIYEKQSRLTLEGNYVMPSDGQKTASKGETGEKLIGITILSGLNRLAVKPDNMYSEQVRETLYDLLNVGLIEDARSIGTDFTAGILNRY